MKHVIYVAMVEEARAVAKELNWAQATQHVWPYSTAFIDNEAQAILITGGKSDWQNKSLSRIGKTAAAQMTALAIERYKPKYVWNVGTCGGIHDQGAKIGDIYTGSVQQNDARIPLPIFGDYTNRILQTQGVELIQNLKLAIKEGLISTGDSFDKPNEVWQHVKQNKAHVVEMEAFAVAEVVQNMMPAPEGKLPLILIKGVTDVVHLENMNQEILETAAEHFQQNLKSLMQNVGTQVGLLLKSL